jgi:hypothetical protein
MLAFDPVTHTYTDDRGVVIPSVTEVISGVGLINFQGIDPQILHQAAAFGTAVHQACALDDLGDLDESTLDENLKPYLDAWRTCSRAMGWKWLNIEEPEFSEVYQFAGTPDRIGEMLVVDIKTGSIVPPWTGLQTAAYSILTNITTARRIAVQLLPNGKFKVTEYTDRKDREVFLSALTVYTWRMAH